MKNTSHEALIRRMCAPVTRNAKSRGAVFRQRSARRPIEADLWRPFALVADIFGEPEQSVSAFSVGRVELSLRCCSDTSVASIAVHSAAVLFGDN